MFGIGTTELIVIAVIIMVLFGHRLPSVMRSLGRGVIEFKRGVAGIEDDVDTAGKPASTQQQHETNHTH